MSECPVARERARAFSATLRRTVTCVRSLSVYCDARNAARSSARAFDAWTLFTQTHKRSVQEVSRIVKHWLGGKLAVAFET